MSLAEAVLEIADDMDKAAEGYKSEAHLQLSLELRSYAKQLRTAVKASGGTMQAVPPQVTAGAQHARELEKHAEEFRGKIPKIDVAVKLLDALEPAMVECADGPHEGDSWPVDQNAPLGAKVSHEAFDDVYILEVREGTKVLRHSLGATNARREQRLKAARGLVIVEGGKEKKP